MSRARTLAGAIGSDGTLNVADVAGLAAVASSGSASDLNTGTLPIARVGDGAVTAAKLAAGAAQSNIGYAPAKLIDLSGQVQAQSYRKSVIALCELTNTNLSFNSWSSGRIIFHRDNSLEQEGFIDIQCAKIYNSNDMRVATMQVGFSTTNLYPCKFTYNGVKYGGVQFYYSAPEHNTVQFFGTGNFGIFGLDYESTTTGVLNSEVKNSLTTAGITYAAGLYVNGVAK